MSTSGSYDFSLTRNQIIVRALRKVKAVKPGQQPTPEQIHDGNENLNLVVKALQNDHIFLWTREWKVKTFSASSQVTGTDGDVYTCIKSHTASADNKPITGSEYAAYWYKTGSTGGTWATATAYTSIGQFTEGSDVIDIEKSFIRDAEKDYPLEIKPLGWYFDLKDKGDTSRPNYLTVEYSNPLTVYLYKQPDVTTYLLHYLTIRKLYDFDNGGNEADFSQRWLSALIYALAVELAPEYDVDIQFITYLEGKASSLKTLAKRGELKSLDEDFVSPAFVE